MVLSVAAIDREDQFELGEIGLHGRASCRDIAACRRDRLAVQAGGAVDLAERRGALRLAAEIGEFRLPVGAELTGHAAAGEQPAHRRRVGLQLRQFAGIFAGQGMSGMVDSNCATFISGPLRPPRAARRSSACFWRSSSSPR